MQVLAPPLLWKPLGDWLLFIFAITSRGPIVLMASDLTLSPATAIELYCVRTRIEFNFRDAKQYWGLEDFMAIHSTPVYNSANLAMLMVNLSQVLIRPLREQCPAFSVNDLKAWFRGRKYVLEVLKWLPQMPEPIFIEQAIARVTELGRVNHKGLLRNYLLSSPHPTLSPFGERESG